MWLLVHLIKFLGRKDSVWPSNKKLCKDTGWNIDKLQRVKKRLLDKGLISVEVKYNTSNVYRFHTKEIKIFIDVDGQELEEKDSIVKHGKQSTVEDGKGYTVKTTNEVLTNEVLFNEEEADLSVLIIDYLNEVKKKNGIPGKSQWTKERAKLIKMRVKASGASSDELKAMIHFKVMEWKGTKVEGCLQIKTLFGDKFQDYIEQSQSKPSKGWIDQSTPSPVHESGIDEKLIYTSMFDKKQ